MRGAFLIFGFLSILPEAQSKGLIDQLTEWKEGQRGFPTEIFRKIEHMEFEKRRNQKRLAKAVSEIFDRVSIAKLLTLTESEFEELPTPTTTTVQGILPGRNRSPSR